jgi:hypothetical protein
MAAASRLGKQIEELVSTLSTAGAPFALIGGLALAPYKVVRATQDVDLLTDSSRAGPSHAALLALGYLCLHRSEDAGNYQREDERVDLIYAHRPAALRLLAAARPLQTPFGKLHVVSAEGLIGLKLQAFVNNPRRTQDLEDIRALLAANREALDMKEIREYFRLFGKEPLLQELIG